MTNVNPRPPDLSVRGESSWAVPPQHRLPSGRPIDQVAAGESRRASERVRAPQVGDRRPAGRTFGWLPLEVSGNRASVM
jgi:hypothetical protein